MLKMIPYKEFMVLLSQLKQKWMSTSMIERKQPKEITEQLVEYKDFLILITFLQVLHSSTQKVLLFTTNL
jgi:hypothetical protein